jgi:hypothetical protein
MKAAGAATRCFGGTTLRSAWDTLGRFPEEAFAPPGTNPSIDWADTTESQRILNYQNHTLQDFVKEQQATMGLGRYLVPLIAPFIRRRMLGQSRYYRYYRKARKQRAA